MVKADYSIRQLAVWRDSIFAARKDLNWSMLDLDEGRNRVSIGVMPGTDLSPNSEFARNVTRRGVPMAALNVMPIGFAEPIRRRMFPPTHRSVTLPIHWLGDFGTRTIATVAQLVSPLGSPVARKASFPRRTALRASGAMMLRHIFAKQ